MASAGKYLKLYDALHSSVTAGLCLYNVPKASQEVPQIDQSVDHVTRDLEQSMVSSSKKCTYCQAVFEDVAEQRAHYKLDWHRYNLKQALLNRQPLSVEQFDKMADDVSSISGSESDTSEDSLDDSDEDDSDRTEDANYDLVHGGDSDQNVDIRDPKIFWKNAEGDVFSLFKCLLLARREVVTSAALHRSLLSFVNPQPKKWLIVMLGGGHFAAAVTTGAATTVHKTFHTYTVRAKQGGGQSAKDGRGSGHASSAGASLRRYNELALLQHVQEIMSAWSDEIAGCSLILYRAVGPHNRSVLFGGKTPPLSKLDPRLRPIPFPTRRATLKEVKRIHDILSTVYCHGDSVEFEKQQQSIRQKSTQEKLPKKPPKHKSERGKERQLPDRGIAGLRDNSSTESAEETAEYFTNDTEISFAGLKEFDDSIRKRKKRKPRPRQRVNLAKRKMAEALEALQSKLVNICRFGNAEQLRQLIAEAILWPARSSEELIRTESASASSNQSTEQEVIPRKENGSASLTKDDFLECLRGCEYSENKDSLLHVAASHNHPEVVQVLLDNDCDPTLRNRMKLVPYVVSGDKATKLAFKTFAARNPNRYNSKMSMIPPPLTAEEEKLQNEKKRERRKQQKEREKIKKKEFEEKKAEQEEKARFLALSDREKRALAAERRIITAAKNISSKMATPVLVRCFLCGVDISGKVPFEYNCLVFCSLPCLKTHRTQKT